MDCKTLVDMPTTPRTTPVPGGQSGQTTYPTLVLQDINYYVTCRPGPWWKGGCFRGKQVKHVLQNVTLDLPAGQLIAVAGSSGSGKTSLLDIITFRNEGYVTGKMAYKGLHCTKDNMQKICSYVIQADRLLPNLTVLETLIYYAYLKLPGETKKSKLEETVESVISRMGLKGVADSRVGGAVVRGISGGERRRVTIAIQLLQEPDILLLDEPTTGLDSFTARHLVASLQQLARQGTLVVLSLHQPRYDIVRMLDQTILMSKGQVVYSGTTSNLVPYFTNLGHECPSYTNPMDRYMDIISVDHANSENRLNSAQRLQTLVEAYQASDLFAATREKVAEQMRGNFVQVGKSYRPSGPSWFRVFLTLVSRMHVNLYRSPMDLLGRLFLMPVFCPFLLMFLGQMKHNQKSIQDRIGLLYQSGHVPPYFGLFNAIGLFVALRNHFYREGFEGLYSSTTFLLAYTVHIAPFMALSGVIFSSVLYWGAGMNPVADHFAKYLAVVLMLHLSGELLTVAIMGIFKNPRLASNTTSLIFAAASLIGSGFLRSLQNMLQVLKYMSWMSFLKYSSEIFVALEFHNLNLTCEDQMQGLPCIPSGEIFIDSNYPGALDHEARNFQVMAAFTVGFFALAAVVFRMVGIRILQ
ncbi:hypothetical protein C0Q70_13795 [Pomacea canaliculata]|uniref:ABC transporter domain-containing protein n=2 Tax=Pomacea canaliculata TaxID=400727 RepID=A0A2T7NY74_POMCA|nr:ATP-binding cassette sub-family G member 5-like isoform X2 [Pomacea canaliculata]XP_025105687.1 ATP-binding cassette sub-family G member 5-like isoform X2 [Pomacea canaliculata]PVD26127.1 hypothetical protein C0Q70_13795 [Pomacea canaliculata]